MCQASGKRAVVEETSGYCLCTQQATTGALPTTAMDNAVEPDNSTWLIVGLVLGALCLLVVIVAVGTLVRKRNNNNNNNDDDTNATPLSDSASHGSTLQYSPAPGPPENIYDSVTMPNAPSVYDQVSAPLE